MATHFHIPVWRIPWTEQLGRLQSTGSQRVWHDWSDLAHTHIHIYIYNPHININKYIYMEREYDEWMRKQKGQNVRGRHIQVSFLKEHVLRFT